jgi:hypothetical protein
MIFPVYAIYAITIELYHNRRSNARGNIDFIEDFYRALRRMPPTKWQTREAILVPRVLNVKMCKIHVRHNAPGGCRDIMI